MKIPFMNCVKCGEQIEGPFEPPELLPPEACPHCGEKPYISSLQELVEKLEQEGLTPVGAAGEAGSDETIDLVKKCVDAYNVLKHELSAEDAALAVLSAMSGATWSVHRGRDAARAMLN